MIHVDRNRIPAPRSLSSPEAVAEQSAAVEFFDKFKTDRQRRFHFEAYRSPEVIQALSDLFHYKCAYCERQVDPNLRAVDMYRPIEGVVERPELPGYWWLSTSWANMLLSCGECSAMSESSSGKTGRGNRFPLEHESRRALRSGEEENEDPLLLDPCRDEPEQHLVFDGNGLVASETARGQASITLYSLNRPNLVRERAAAARRLVPLRSDAEALLRGLTVASDDPARSAELSAIADDLRRQTADADVFAGLKRQLLLPLLERIRDLGLEQSADFIGSTPSVSQSRQTAVKRSFTAYQVKQSNFSLETAADIDTGMRLSEVAGLRVGLLVDLIEGVAAA